MSAVGLICVSAATLGTAFAIVAGVATLEWAMPDADLLGHDLHEEPCCRCGDVVYRAGLCADCWELAMDDDYADGAWS